MKNKLIRIITASLVSMFVAIMFIKFGLKLHIHGLEKIWGIPMALAIAYIVSEDIKILKEKEESSISLG